MFDTSFGVAETACDLVDRTWFFGVEKWRTCVSTKLEFGVPAEISKRFLSKDYES